MPRVYRKSYFHVSACCPRMIARPIGAWLEPGAESPRPHQTMTTGLPASTTASVRRVDFRATA